MIARCWNGRRGLGYDPLSRSSVALALPARGSKDHAEHQPDASAYRNPQAHIAEGGAEDDAQCSAHNKANADVVLFHGLNIANAGE